MPIWVDALLAYFKMAGKGRSAIAFFAPKTKITCRKVQLSFGLAYCQFSVAEDKQWALNKVVNVLSLETSRGTCLRLLEANFDCGHSGCLL